jgi:YVTN family beta-propeller protein
MFRTVVAGVGVLLVAACGGSSSRAGTAPSSGPTTPSYVVATVHAGTQPCAVEGGFGSVWVSVYGGDEELRIDPQTREVVARIKTGLSPCGIAVGGGSVWVENYGGDSVTRIDPKTNNTTTIKVGSNPYDVTYAAGAAWVTNFSDDTVSRIDAKTGKVQTVKVGLQPVGIAPADGAVWVTNQSDGTISRIDPATLKVRTTKVGLQPAWTSWGDGRLWVSVAGGINEVDLDTGHTSQRVELSGQPNDGDIVDGTVWVTDGDGKLHAVDAESGEERGAWPTGLSNPFVLAGWDSLLWIVDFKGTDLIAVDPAKINY